jgi:hypothetical protein
MLLDSRSWAIFALGVALPVGMAVTALLFM